MCVSQPVNVSHNMSFLVDARSLQHKEDLKCDDMGAWKHNGSPKCWFHVENNSRGKKRITAVDKKSNPVRATEDVYELRELTTRIRQIRMFAKLSPNYTVCNVNCWETWTTQLPHLLD